MRRSTTSLLGWSLVVLVSLGLSGWAHAQGPESQSEGEAEQGAALGDLSLEELLDVEVTSVAKKRQSLLSAPAAVFVVTADDIRRAGVKTIPDALRMVPGMHVARVNGSRWAISARGFDGMFGNKLLVMIDGRVVYTPLFSGVFWDVQDTLLADIERIEVVRGPGGALWGSNAVNGVINIITKNSADTVGGLAAVGVGTETRMFAAARQGFALGDSGTARVFAKVLERDAGATAMGRDATDSWGALRFGLRADWQLEQGGEFTLIGDAHTGDTSTDGNYPIPTAPYVAQSAAYGDTEGGSLLARCRLKHGDGADSLVQVFWDYAAREIAPIDSELHTADVELQHGFAPWGAHTLMIGGGFRWVGSSYQDNFVTRSRNPERDLRVFSAFVHDQFELVADAVTLTLGAKIEHNEFSGYEFQPDARLMWSGGGGHSLWGAVSRAARTPSMADTDGIITATSGPGPGGLPLTTALYGNQSLGAEEALSFELGYRFRNENRFYLDAAAFYTEYDGILTYQAGVPIVETTPTPRITVPLHTVNAGEAYSYGLELAASWQPTEYLRLSGAYTLLRIESDYGAGTISVFPPPDGTAPRHSAHLRAAWNPTDDLRLDGSIAYNGRRSGQGIPSYVRLDLRAAWRFGENTEVEIVGQNLLEDQHPEFSSTLWYGASEVERSAYFQVTQRF